MPTVLVAVNEVTSSLPVLVAQAGYGVVEAHSISAVLEEILRKLPDVVILPDGAETPEGVDLLAVVRYMTEAVIIVVGKGGESRMAQVLLQGANSYLPHPVEPPQIRSRLRSLLRRQSRRGRSTG